MPWVPEGSRLNNLKSSVDRIGDGAALVQAIRHCHETKQSPPAWAVAGLELLLLEFAIALSPPGKRLRIGKPLFSPWARKYVGSLRDWFVADHVETNRRVYGMTQAEALDEAGCWFRSTRLAGSMSQMEHAWKRARQRAKVGWFQRLPSTLESSMLANHFAPLPAAGSSRTHWWTLNSDRMGDERGQWVQRPELLAGLDTSELERRVKAMRNSAGQKRHR